FDVWTARQFPHLPFERYADDAIVHCRTKREAEEVRNAVAQRLQECRLELHPEKTKIVYCKDEDGEEMTQVRNSIFLVIRFVRGSRKRGGANSSSISLRPSPQALRRPSVMKSEVGGCNHAR